jgi:hypothetical protein
MEISMMAALCCAPSVTGLKKNRAKMIAPTNMLDCKVLRKSRRMSARMVIRWRLGFVGIPGNCEVVTKSKTHAAMIEVKGGDLNLPAA